MTLTVPALALFVFSAWMFVGSLQGAYCAFTERDSVLRREQWSVVSLGLVLSPLLALVAWFFPV